MKRLLGLLPLLFLFFCAACSSKTEKMRIAATKVPHAEMLEHIRPDLHRQGIDLEIMILDDYEGANKNLAEGVTDANFFQHFLFLKQQVAEFQYPIESLVAIHIEPMQFYSSKIKSLDELQSSSVIGIPQDPANLARALNLLAVNGLIKVGSKSDTTKLTLKDVKTSSSSYYLFAMEASELSGALETVDVAVIPGNFALEAHLAPMNDTVLLEDNVSDYANVIAICTTEARQKRMAILKKAMTSSKMRDFILEKYKGTVIPIF